MESGKREPVADAFTRMAVYRLRRNPPYPQKAPYMVDMRATSITTVMTSSIPVARGVPLLRGTASANLISYNLPPTTLLTSRVPSRPLPQAPLRQAVRGQHTSPCSAKSDGQATSTSGDAKPGSSGSDNSEAPGITHDGTNGHSTAQANGHLGGGAVAGALSAASDSSASATSSGTSPESKSVEATAVGETSSTDQTAASLVPAASNASPTPSGYDPAAHRSSSKRRKKADPVLRMKDMLQSAKPIIETTGLLALWYASNIFYNIYNKQALQVYPHAMTCTFIHIVVAIALMASPLLLKLKPVPKVTNRTFQAVIPLAILHLVGFLTTNMSLGAVNVSLTHTIKSLEPFFTVVITFFLYGSLPAWPVLVTLLPIVAGVVVASATDLSFNWYGFVTAMGSNFAFQSRNVISKRYMTESSLACLEGGMEPEEVLNETDLFLGISLMALPLAIPVMLAWDGPGLVSRMAAVQAADPFTLASAAMPANVLGKTLIAGVCRTADVFASYGLLSRLNPVTHSVANCVKRVVVIAVSIVFFATKSSYLNIVGTVLALAGVFAYSMAERSKANRKVTSTGPTSTPMATRMVSWMQITYVKLVPGFVTTLLQQKAAEKAAKERAAKAEEDKKNIEPEYNL
eukprot:gene30815-35848_t